MSFQVTQTNAQSATLASISAEFIANWGGDLRLYTKPANGTPNDSVTERMRITSDGAIGIGCSTPSYRLDIVDTCTSGVRGLRINTASNSVGPSIVLRYSPGGLINWLVGTSQAVSHAFEFVASCALSGDPGVNGTTRMILTCGGQLGIGTISTSAEANLFLGAKSTIEGGQMVFQKGTSCSCATHLDNYADSFRVLVGDDIGSNGVHMLIDHKTRNACFYGAVLSSAPNNGYNFRALGFSTGVIAGGGSCLVYSSLDRGLYLISISSSVTSIYGYSAFLWVDSSDITVSSVIRQACVAITTSGRALTVVNQYTAEAAAMTISTLNLVNYLGA
jgi:hypothetical protein